MRYYTQTHTSLKHLQENTEHRKCAHTHIYNIRHTSVTKEVWEEKKGRDGGREERERE